MERQRVSVFQFQFFQTAHGLQWHFSSELKVDLQYINLIENWSSFQHEWSIGINHNISWNNYLV